MIHHKGISYKFICLEACNNWHSHFFTCFVVSKVFIKKWLAATFLYHIPMAITSEIKNLKTKLTSHFLVPVVFLLFTASAFAQQKYSLTIHGIPTPQNITYIHTFSDSLKAYKQVDSVRTQLKLKGFFNCTIIHYYWLNAHLNVTLQAGNRYKWLEIKNGNINPNAFNLKKSYYNRFYNTEELSTTYQHILAWYENNGYPFAQVWLDSFTFSNHSVSAKFYSITHTKITIDSVLIIGNAKLTPNYINACLDIKPNDLYQENKIALIDKRLQNLPIIYVYKNTEINFVADKATINLFINQKNANQFDGIIGFLPSIDGNRLQLTGDFKLKLHNTLKRGELIDLNYRGLPNQSQQLLTKLNYPYLLLSKIGLDIDFQLFKKDTSFLNLNTKIGFSYTFNPDKAIHVFVENYKGNLIGNSTNLNNTTLPFFTNITTTYFGLGTSIENTNNNLLPSKGYKILINASVGDRNINKSKDFNPNNFDNINPRSTQYKFVADFNFYLPITSKFNVYLHNQVSVITGSSIFENEAFRIGGFKTLRGFNEQSILASSYAIQTIETRYFIEKKSFLFTFYDQAFMQQSFITGKKNDIPLGLGAGISFETKLGFMSLSYALGKQKNNPLNLRNGKIHFGLISNF
ncbi:MAG: hypothetical protein EAZ51_01775 [Sphingobacteriales bacterium]|nr:MAG: hypothetical protein EAZ64_05065 [Sphingobacteriales bacterium]TAF82828.1 MAG: hypothetical protein EAZ51_01775 [Sphingobacteriales bacterium]